VTTYRVLRFKQLSETADVELIDYRTEGIRFTFHGKYLGSRKGRNGQGTRRGRRPAQA
jgi:hypothetical protein